MLKSVHVHKLRLVTFIDSKKLTSLVIFERKKTLQQDYLYIYLHPLVFMLIRFFSDFLHVEIHVEY